VCGFSPLLFHRFLSSHRIFLQIAVFTFDGRDVTRETDALAVGKVRVSTVWSKDGKNIVITTSIDSVPQYNIPGTLTSTYSLQDSSTMIISLELRLADNTSFAPAKRIFRKKVEK
jgi:hypothetical protein